MLVEKDQKRAENHKITENRKAIKEVKGPKAKVRKANS
jgi:hypothetical protein